MNTQVQQDTNVDQVPQRKVCIRKQSLSSFETTAFPWQFQCPKFTNICQIAAAAPGFLWQMLYLTFLFSVCCNFLWNEEIYTTKRCSTNTFRSKLFYSTCIMERNIILGLRNSQAGRDQKKQSDKQTLSKHFFFYLVQKILGNLLFAVPRKKGILLPTAVVFHRNYKTILKIYVPDKGIKLSKLGQKNQNSLFPMKQTHYFC